MSEFSEKFYQSLRQLCGTTSKRKKKEEKPETSLVRNNVQQDRRNLSHIMRRQLGANVSR